MGSTLIEWILAWRYVRARHSDGFISAIAIFALLGTAIGVAVLIITLSVMNGFRSDLYKRILGLNGHIVVSAGQTLGDADRLAERLRALAGVVSAVPIIEGQAMVINRGTAQGAMVRGVRPIDLVGRPLLSRNLYSGRFVDFESGNGLLLGERLRRDLRLAVGDTVTLLWPRSEPGQTAILPRSGEFGVAGSFSIRLIEYDSGYLFMPIDQARRFFELPEGTVNAIEVWAANAEYVADLRERIAGELGPEFKVVDWQQRNQSFVNALLVERAVMFIILSLIVLVAALNVVVSFTMLVRSKARNIAILRAMGATRWSVLRTFLIASAGIGVGGTAIGAALGLVVCANMASIRAFAGRLAEGMGGNTLLEFFASLPAVIDPGEVTAIMVMALSLSLIAALYVAWRAAGLEPAEALRYE